MTMLIMKSIYDGMDESEIMEYIINSKIDNINYQNDDGYTLAMILAKKLNTTNLHKIFPKIINSDSKFMVTKNSKSNLAMIVATYHVKSNPKLTFDMLKMVKPCNLNLQDLRGYTLSMIISIRCEDPKYLCLMLNYFKQTNLELINENGLTLYYILIEYNTNDLIYNFAKKFKSITKPKYYGM